MSSSDSEVLTQDLSSSNPFEAFTDTKARLLTIPTWGWTGDGKTCALLAALFHLEAPEHGVGLALVDDPGELDEVIESTDAFQGLSLAEVARSTRARVPRLLQKFVDECTWPPGTDEPTPYLFRVRGRRSTLGYAFMPDIQGGGIF